MLRRDKASGTLQLALSQTFEMSELGGEAGLCKWIPVERMKIHSLHSYINNTAFCQFLLFQALSTQTLELERMLAAKVVQIHNWFL